MAIGFTIEVLEPRKFFTVLAPTITSGVVKVPFGPAPPNTAGSFAEITIDDLNTNESGYRIQWSEDAVNWPGAMAPGADVEVGEFVVGPNPGQGVFNVVHDLDAGQRLYYRAQALDGANPPSGFSPAVRSTNDARTATLQPEVRATPAGLRISWSADLSPDSAVALYRKLRSQQEFAQISYTNREPHAVTDPDVQADVRYEYRLDVTPPGGTTRRAFVAAGISLSRVEQRGNVLIARSGLVIRPSSTHSSTAVYRSPILAGT